MRATALTLIAGLLLAGCLGDEPAGSAAINADAGPAPDTPRAADGAASHVARHAEPATAIDETRWFNGTFTFDQHRRVGPLPRPAEAGEPAGVVRHDITALVPRGVPSRILVQVDAELSHGDLDVGLHVPDGEWRTGNFDTPFGGQSRFEVGVVHLSSEPIHVVLVYDEAEPAADFAYALSVRVVSEPDLLLGGIVTGVTLPGDARFDVETIGAPRERGPEVEAYALHVYGPDDAYVGAFPLESATTTIALPEGSPAGEYALLLSQGGRSARLLLAEPATLRPLGMEWVEGEPATFDAQGRATWTMDLARTPLLAGIFFTSPNLAHNVEASLAGPEGEIFSGRASGDVPWTSLVLPDGSGFSNGFGWDSLYGARGLAAGTYEATVAFETAAGAQPAQGRIFAAFHAR